MYIYLYIYILIYIYTCINIYILRIHQQLHFQPTLTSRCVLCLCQGAIQTLQSENEDLRRRLHWLEKAQVDKTSKLNSLMAKAQIR